MLFLLFLTVIDLGTQRNDYGGNITYKRQVLIIWEVPDQISNDVPMTISKFYTLSLHEKSNLGMDLVSWRGRPFTEQEKQQLQEKVLSPEISRTLLTLDICSEEDFDFVLITSTIADWNILARGSFSLLLNEL